MATIVPLADADAVSGDIAVTAPPSEGELAALRALDATTRALDATKGRLP